MTVLHSYSRLSTLNRQLLERLDACDEEKRIFLLPSLSSRDVLLDMLAIGGVYFGNTPKILSWTGLYDLLVPPLKRRRLLDPHDQRLILRFVLNRNIAALDDQRIQIPQGVRRKGFIDVLSAALHELLLEDVSADRLLRLEERSETSDASLSSRELLFMFYTDYLMYLEENDLADNAQIPSLCRKHILDSTSLLTKQWERRVFYWVGFLSFTGAQLKLVKLLRRSGVRMEFFMPETGLDRFHDAAKQLGMEKSPREEAAGNFLLLKAADSYEQFDWLARTIALAGAGEGALSHHIGAKSSETEIEEKNEMLDDVGIMLASDKRPLMESALTKYGISFQVYSEKNLSHSRPIDLVRRAWNAYRLDWPFRSTRYLLTEPMLKANGFDFERAEREIPEGFDSWKEFLRDDEKTVRMLDRLLAFCKLLDDSKGHTAAELLRSLLDLIERDWEAAVSEAVVDEPALDDLVRETASSVAELRQKIDSLAEMSHRLGEAAEMRFSGDEAMRFILDWSDNTHLALPSLRRGVVTLYDSPPPVLFSHRIWAMTDVDSSRFPGASSEHLLLNEEIRRNVNERFPDEVDEDWAVHLPTLHEVREQKEALFRRLLAMGEGVTLLSRSSGDSQGRPQSPSPFLTSVWPEDLSGESPEEITAPPCEVPDTERSYGGLFPRIARSRVRRGKNSETKLRVRLSSIDDWNDCPFLWWCRNVACLQPRGEAKGLLDRALQGDLMHKLWQGVWSRYLRKEPGCRSLASTLVTRWDEMFEILSGGNPILRDRRYLEVLKNLKNDMSIVAERQDDVEARAKTAGLLREETLMEYPLPVYEGENALFSGRADRIDIWKGLGAVVVDYKLGEASRFKDHLQLPAYVNLLQRDGAFPVAGFCYIGHKDASLGGAWSGGAEAVYKAPKARSGWDLAEKQKEAALLLKTMDEAIGLGRYPAEYRSRRCGDCLYSILCRRSECAGEGGVNEKNEESDGAY